MDRLLMFLYLALCLFFNSCQVEAGVPISVQASLVSQLASNLASYSNYYAISDFVSLTNTLYASDCQYIPSGHNIGIQYGRSAVMSWLMQMSYGVASLNFSAIETGSDNNTPSLVYQVGLYDMYDLNNTLHDAGKFVLLWEVQDDGTWEIYVHIYNSSLKW